MVFSQIVATCLGIALIILAIILRTGKIPQFLALFFAGVYFTLVGLFPTQTHKLNVFNLFQVTTVASAQTAAINASVTVDPDTGIVFRGTLTASLRRTATLRALAPTPTGDFDLCTAVLAGNDHPCAVVSHTVLLTTKFTLD